MSTNMGIFSVLEEKVELNTEISSYSLTEFKEESFSHLWILNNCQLVFNSWKEDFSSSTFLGLGHEWYLKIEFLKQEPKLHLRLKRLKDGFKDKSIKARYFIKFFDHDDKSILTTAPPSEYTDFVPEIEGNFVNMGLYSDQKLSIIDVVKDVSSLKIKVEVTLLKKVQIRKKGKWIDSNGFNFNRIVDLDLKDKFTDFEILVEETSIKVHKLVLAAQSEDFLKMIESGFSESKANQIKITDFSVSIVEEMVGFFYTGGIENWPKENNEIFELLKISDKYNLTLMGLLCENKILEELNLENCAELLILANCSNAGLKLKTDILDFIKKNLSELKSVPSFKANASENSQYFIDVLFFKE